MSLPGIEVPIEKLMPKILGRLGEGEALFKQYCYSTPCATLDARIVVATASSILCCLLYL